MKFRTVLLAVVLAGLCGYASALTGIGDSPVGVLDTVAPEISDLQVSRAVASPGDTITITFTSSEPLSTPPTVTMHGHLADFVGESGGIYTYIYVVGSFDSDGPAEVAVGGTDAGGNSIVTTNAPIITFDMPPLPLHVWPMLVALVVAAAFASRRRSASVAIVVALLWASPAMAQIPVVSNVSFVQQANGSGGTEVVITYDLVSPSSACDITVWMSKDAGADGFVYPATSILGDILAVESGVGKTIVWDIAADYPNEHIAQAQLRLLASTRPQDCFDWTAGYPGHLFANSAACQNNLKHVGLICRQFDDDNHGFPRLSSDPGRLMFRDDEIYPNCVIDPEILTCPGRLEETPAPYFDDTHYVYLGYLLANDADVVAFADAYADEIAAAGDFSGNLPAVSSYGPEIYRLRDGVERFLVTDINDPQQFIDAAARIPVMFDWPDNHQAGWGGNVLYLDGHVEFQEYPGEFPMTETTIATLATLAGYVPPTEWQAPYSPYTPAVSPSLGPLCRQNLAQVGISLMMFMNESQLQCLPVLSSEQGRLMMDDEALYPVYLQNPNWLICPGTAEITPAPFFDDPHFAYLGYLVVNDSDVDAFAAAYTAEIADDADFSGDLPVATSYGNVLYRLREGVEQFLTSDLNDPTDCVPRREVPILFEWPDNHEGLSGGHVVYLDGHVEWQPYPGEFPMTEHAITTLAALANRPANTAWATLEPVNMPESDPYHQGLCEHNMGFLGLSFKTFNGHHDGWFPELAETAGLMMMEPQGLVPYHLNALERLHCPGSEFACTPPAADDDSYAYLGYVVLSDSDMAAFATAHAAQLSGSGNFSGDLPGTMSYGNTIYRLREGVERTISDESAIELAQSQIPVLIEWPDNHSDLRGGNVLYMDGHAEWHDYPGEFPMTEATIALLANMAGRPPID